MFYLHLCYSLKIILKLYSSSIFNISGGNLNMEESNRFCKKVLKKEEFECGGKQPFGGKKLQTVMSLEELKAIYIIYENNKIQYILEIYNKIYYYVDKKYFFSKDILIFNFS